VASLIAGLVIVTEGPDLAAIEPAIVDLRRRAAAVALVVLRTDGAGDATALAEIADVVLDAETPPRILAAQLRALARLIALEPPTTNPEVVNVRGITIDLDRREVRVGGRPLALTPTEFRILALLARKRGVVTHGELFREIHAYEVSDQEAKDILKVHVWRLRAKLAEIVPDSHLIVNVRGFGYLLERRARDRLPRSLEDRPA
jgi:two-component system, OmpR family, response regulator RegX3